VPDLVIQVGRPPTDAGWNRAFGRWEEGRRWVIAPFDWADPWNRAAGVIRSELTTALDALSRAISDARPDAEPSPGPGPAPSGPSTWRDRLVDVDARARAMIEASIEDEFAE